MNIWIEKNSMKQYYLEEEKKKKKKKILQSLTDVQMEDITDADQGHAKTVCKDFEITI